MAANRAIFVLYAAAPRSATAITQDVMKLAATNSFVVIRPSLSIRAGE
jgi:hypothetical protein